MSGDSVEERMWDKGYSRGYQAGLEEGLRTTHNEAEAAIYWASGNGHVTDAQHQKLVKKLDNNVRTLAKFLGVRVRV